MDKEAAKRQIASLVEKYRNYESSGKLENLGETDTRAIFIDPLFEYLGWGMKNIEEVSREDRVSKGWVDYAFRLSGVVRFFLEAKAANEELGEKEAWQAINYAYFKSVPWAVLTNFRKLVIYSSEWKTRKSEDSRFLTFDVDEYLERFDELWLLGNESISKGEIDAFAEKVGKKAKREPVSRALVEDLTCWRKLLGKSIRKFDPRKKFTRELLDEAVQRFLDRLIFIRTCEDRGFENERLRAAVREYPKSGRKLGGHVNEIFLEFRDSYDSDIFFPHMAGDLTLDNDVLEQVVMGMYESPEGVPYNFAHIDADILGNVYEQYLAMMAREGGGLQEKEAKRKEMGIYYTPTYIVDYIVKNTLGEFISKAKNAGDLEKIRILDPACGSGSFLIRAYEELYRAYVKKNGGDNEMLGENMSKNAHSILTRNLYGVDLDPKAVEIAELNLLLKAAVRKGLLPPLSDNIKNGNSLISGSGEELEKHFGSDWEKKKPFNWESEFREVMDSGGFDVVIGNPPYGADLDKKDLEYLKGGFATGKIKNYDTYAFFVERALYLLKDGAYFGFILPNTFLRKLDFEPLRNLILSNFKVMKVVELGPVFEAANVTENVIIILQKMQDVKKRKANKIFLAFLDKEVPREQRLIRLSNENWLRHGYIVQSDWESAYGKRLGTYTNEKEISIIKKMERTGTPLGDMSGFEIGRGEEGSKEILHEERKGPDDAVVLIPEDVSKYGIEYPKRFGKFSKDVLLGYKKEKILIIRIRNESLKDRIIAALDSKGVCIMKTLQYISLADTKDTGLFRYMLGLLNSTLMNYFCTYYIADDINKRYLETLPIVPMDKADKKIAEQLVKQVEKRISLMVHLNEIGGMQTSERQKLEDEIVRMDRDIDEQVYKIYGITSEEREIIEERLGHE